MGARDALTRTSRRARTAVLFTWAGVLLFVIAWFLTTQQARFLVPVMPALAVLAALGVLELIRQGGLTRGLVIAVTAGALAAGLGASTVYASQFVPVVVGASRRSNSCARRRLARSLISTAGPSSGP